MSILVLVLFCCFHNKGALCASYSFLRFYCRPILWRSLWSQVFCTFRLHFGAFFGCQTAVANARDWLWCCHAWHFMLQGLYPSHETFTWAQWNCFHCVSSTKTGVIALIKDILWYTPLSPPLSLPPPFSPSLLPFQPMEKCSSESAQERAYGSDLDSYSLYGRRRDLVILCRIETMAD